ncbi:MAG: Sigma-70 family polymerase sigma factor, partial [Acidobacteriota bacterium]|nr:Sigma-70 family polymerase sigma factor [Acidobacteriota bacterium]
MIESDAETIAGFLRGDAAAAALIDGWLASAAGAFRSRLGAHWEDLLQDARLEILRQLRRGSFRGESSLKTYVWRVTLHACLNRLRARRRWRFEELNFDLEPTREPSPF